MRIEQIYIRYKEQLRGFVFKRTSSVALSEDIVQDVFSKFFVADKEDSIEAISAWLYRAAQNQITDHFRKKKEERIDFEKAEKILSNENSAEDILFNDLVWEQLKEALAELPEEQRVAFELNELNGIPFTEIAEVTNTPINTLISRKRYAVVHLRKRLKELYDELKIESK